MAAKKRRRLKHGTKATAKPRAQVRLNPAPWDMGADGPASRSRESDVVEAADPEVVPETGEVKRRNPNGVTRRQFYDMLDVYHRRGWISASGFEAGKKLRAAWEATEKGIGNDWSKERVDSSPKPDAAIAIQIDRMSALVGITRRIPQGDYRILINVACEGQAIGRLREYRGFHHEAGKAHLRDALDRLACRIGC